jgi:hypothetical protein
LRVVVAAAHPLQINPPRVETLPNEMRNNMIFTKVLGRAKSVGSLSTHSNNQRTKIKVSAITHFYALSEI